MVQEEPFSSEIGTLTSDLFALSEHAPFFSPQAGTPIQSAPPSIPYTQSTGMGQESCSNEIGMPMNDLFDLSEYAQRLDIPT
jgi:hypothetical protein